MEATTAVEAHASMEATAMKAPKSTARADSATAVEAPAECSEATRTGHHPRSRVEAAAIRSRSAIDAVGVIAASYVVITWAPVMNVSAEVVIVGSVAVSVSIPIPSIPVPKERGLIHPPG